MRQIWGGLEFLDHYDPTPGLLPAELSMLRTLHPYLKYEVKMPTVHVYDTS